MAGRLEACPCAKEGGPFGNAIVRRVEVFAVGGQPFYGIVLDQIGDRRLERPFVRHANREAFFVGTISMQPRPFGKVTIKQDCTHFGKSQQEFMNSCGIALSPRSGGARRSRMFSSVGGYTTRSYF